MADLNGEQGKPPVKRQAGGVHGTQPSISQGPQAVPEVRSSEVDNSFDFSQLAQSSPARRGGRRKRSRLSLPVVLGVAAAFCLAVVAAGLWLLPGENALAIRPIEAQEIDELTPLVLSVEAEDPTTARGRLEFSLPTAPEGARIDSQTGEFFWRPTEAQGPGSHEVVVRVVDRRAAERHAEARFTVEVREVNVPPVLAFIADKKVTVTPSDSAAAALTFTVKAKDPDQPAAKLKFELLPGAPAGARVDALTGEFLWDTSAVPSGKEYEITIRVSEVTAGDNDSPGGLMAEESFTVRVQRTAAPVDGLAGEPDAPVWPPEIDVPPPVEVPADRGEDPVVSPPAEDEDAPVLELYREEKLFALTEYPTLRKFFADRFQRRHQDEIRRALSLGVTPGKDFEEMMQWFDDHPVVREEFFTAIDPEHDKVVEALKLFAQLKQRSPERTALYWNLAIATAVTWDDERRGVYDYVNHQRRTKSNLREGRLAAVENFEYMIAAEQYMQLRARFLPWEFLVHVVNHKTPADERAWARQNYAPRIVMFGKCYKDVPYDNEMLDSGDKRARLNGKDYSLPGLKMLGGVCSMQADFSARVGKSIGVPAAYVHGDSAYGEGHAWVMWVELRNVTKDNITFSLQSEGRYRGDKFYVGTLRDPQTGQKITDRQLELRLHAVGMSPQKKRHAAMLMETYPILVEKTEMDVTGRLAFLSKVVELCPGNEAAWTAAAGMSRDGEIAEEQHKQMNKAVNMLFVTFARFPDFTWEIFDDLIAFQEVPKQRAALYERLVVLYEQAGRPDLACEARLKYTEYLVNDEQHKQAIAGLATTIMKFPEEGRYVPKMLDKLEEICTQVPEMQAQLALFYHNFLPQVPRMRGDRPSPYCMKVYARAIEVFRKNGRADLAQLYQMQLAAMKAQERG